MCVSVRVCVGFADRQRCMCVRVCACSCVRAEIWLCARTCVFVSPQTSVTDKRQLASRFTEAENVKRKSVSEPSWERIDHVYTSTLYLSLAFSSSLCPKNSSFFLSLPPSVCHIFSLLSLPPFLSASSSSLKHSLLLAAVPVCLSYLKVQHSATL